VTFIETRLEMHKMQQILTLKFLEVVREHISGVVSNVIYSFAGNLTGFPAIFYLFSPVAPQP